MNQTVYGVENVFKSKPGQDRSSSYYFELHTADKCSFHLTKGSTEPHVSGKTLDFDATVHTNEILQVAEDDSPFLFDAVYIPKVFSPSRRIFSSGSWFKVVGIEDFRMGTLTHCEAFLKKDVQVDPNKYPVHRELFCLEAFSSFPKTDWVELWLSDHAPSNLSETIVQINENYLDYDEGLPTEILNEIRRMNDDKSSKIISFINRELDYKEPRYQWLTLWSGGYGC
tara:strand:+ start:117 stop:794 length:678 start_codon:yes stop_codon:yes gene_type:complete